LRVEDAGSEVVCRCQKVGVGRIKEEWKVWFGGLGTNIFEVSEGTQLSTTSASMMCAVSTETKHPCD
jgi:hypothetical protein